MASAVRRRIDDRLVLEAAGRLTERDRYLCRLLLDHQVLTTEQIRSIGFVSQRRTRLRLAQLHQLRVLDRFRPLAKIGSAQHHWILDTLGALAICWRQLCLHMGGRRWLITGRRACLVMAALGLPGVVALSVPGELRDGAFGAGVVDEVFAVGSRGDERGGGCVVEGAG